MNKFLTNRQISVILFSIVVGYTITDLPKGVAEHAGTASWLVLLINTMIFILSIYIITFLQYAYSGKTIYEYGEKLIGKFTTKLLLLLYLIYFFIYFSMFVRGYSETIKGNLLNKTPVSVICIIFFIVLAYALMKGINAIARICEIYVPIIILGYMFVFYALATQGKWVNIRPLFVFYDIMEYLKALPNTISPFLGGEILLFIPIGRRENKNIFKYTMLTMGFIGTLYIYIVESIISVVGTDLLVKVKLPILPILRGIDIYTLEFIRRLDGIYIVFRVMNIFCTICLLGYGIIVIINRLLRNIKYNFSIIVVVFMSFIVSQMPNTMFQSELIIKYNGYLGIVLGLLIPVILFIITKVKRYDKKI